MSLGCVGSRLSLRGSGDSVGKAPVVQREFFSQNVLVAFHRIHLVNCQIELEGQAVDLLARVPSQLELGITESPRGDVEFGIKVIGPVHLSDAAETVGAPNSVAISPVIHGRSGISHVSENDRAICLVLKAYDDIDNFQVTLRAGAEVGDGGGKVIGFIAERLAAAE